MTERHSRSRTLIEALCEEERAMLIGASGDEACGCQDGMFPNPGRRRLVFGAGGLVAAGLAGPARSQHAAVPSTTPYPTAPMAGSEDPTRTPGRPIRDGVYGERSGFETESRRAGMSPNPLTAWSMTPLASGLGVITPSGLHFERFRNGAPLIDPRRHHLFVHGLVERPRKFGMTDLKRFPSRTRTHFIECNGNTASEWRAATMKTVQFTHGLLSTSEWTGVPFSTLALEVGLKPGAAWVLAEGGDGAVMTRSVPLEKMMHDALLVYGQNGEAIRPEQGYPLRLLLPGWEGNINIKWLRRLEISDTPFMTREETATNTDLLPDGRARQFSFEVDAKSVITFPSGEMRLPGPGFYEISGLAWSGRGKVRRVEVSADGGRTWAAATLQTPVLSMSTTRFRFPWTWDGQPAVLQSRCTDEAGYIQPTRQKLAEVRGLASHYHNNGVQSWAVAADGSVSNVWA